MTDELREKNRVLIFSCLDLIGRNLRVGWDDVISHGFNQILNRTRRADAQPLASICLWA